MQQYSLAKLNHGGFAWREVEIYYEQFPCLFNLVIKGPIERVICIKAERSYTKHG